jgi:protein ImuA
MEHTVNMLPVRSLSSPLPWQPGQHENGPPEDDACHGEIFASAQDASGAALALALAQDRLRLACDPLADTPDERPWLWVQDREAMRLTGLPCRAGLPQALRHRLIHVAARTPADALFALEEGLRCRDLVFVLGEIAGNPRALDLTASRRLGLAAERHGVPLWLIRLEAQRDLGSARMRWQVRSAPSGEEGPAQWNPQAPGAPAWQAELFRARRHPPGEWRLMEADGGLVSQPWHGVADNADASSARSHA